MALIRDAGGAHHDILRTLRDNLGVVPAVVWAEEVFALCIEAGKRCRACEVSEMIPPFAILRLVVDDAIFNLHFADIEIALEIRRVILRIPETEFDE